ncbi:hypothetical protein D3C77_427990 [compost metagenome]
MAAFSSGDAGDYDISVIVKSGLGAGVPYTSNSAICPAEEPVLVVNLSCSSLAVADTGIVTLFPEAGLKV